LKSGVAITYQTRPTDMLGYAGFGGVDASGKGYFSPVLTYTPTAPNSAPVNFRYLFMCSQGIYNIVALVIPDAYNNNAAVGIGSAQLVGIGGNTCSPFSLPTWTASNVYHPFLPFGLS
jgi:hypothetical protein